MYIMSHHKRILLKTLRYKCNVNGEVCGITWEVIQSTRLFLFVVKTSLHCENLNLSFLTGSTSNQHFPLGCLEEWTSCG